ncbi:MAG: hypothetical protein V9F04_13885 [Dermatophilaceae bacterium]
MADPVVRSLEELGDLLKHPAAFRPPVLTAVRENLSVLQGRGPAASPHQSRAVRAPTPTPTACPCCSSPASSPPTSLSRRWPRPLRAPRPLDVAQSGIAPEHRLHAASIADGLERRLEVVPPSGPGSKVAIVGWSRGGTLGKIVDRAPARPASSRSSPSGRRTPHPLAVNATLSAAARSCIAKLHVARHPRPARRGLPVRRLRPVGDGGWLEGRRSPSDIAYTVGVLDGGRRHRLARMPRPARHARRGAPRPTWRWAPTPRSSTSSCRCSARSRPAPSPPDPPRRPLD